MTTPKDYEVRLEYFTWTGKLKYRASFLPARDLIHIPGDHHHPRVDMIAARDHVLLQQLTRTLPSVPEGTWDGPIRLDAHLGYPVLIIPDREQ